jgi:hypothetical protein
MRLLCLLAAIEIRRIGAIRGQTDSARSPALPENGGFLKILCLIFRPACMYKVDDE